MFERYTRYQTEFDNPHAHPNAYERLYRLRVAFTAGRSVDKNAGYEVVLQDEAFHLARALAKPNPEAIRFSDAIAQSLLTVLRKTEEEEKLPSPFNELFNRFCEADLAEDRIEEFWAEIARWIFLGSPVKVVHHLVELKWSCEDQLKEVTDTEHRNFLNRALTLIAEVSNRMHLIEDYSLRRALRRYAKALG